MCFLCVDSYITLPTLFPTALMESLEFYYVIYKERPMLLLYDYAPVWFQSPVLPGLGDELEALKWNHFFVLAPRG